MPDRGSGTQIRHRGTRTIGWTATLGERGNMNQQNALPRPSKSLIFQVSDFDREVADVVSTIPPPARWSGFNAIRHLNKAWRLREDDREMAMFRAITAEEEAATAIFHSLQRLRYPGASGLNPRNHIHKNALAPFLHAVAMALNQVPFDKFRGTLQNSSITTAAVQYRFIGSFRGYRTDITWNPSPLSIFDFRKRS